MDTLAVVEILGRNGEVVARERICHDPFLVGRAFDADVILEDEFVAPHHLRISRDGQGFCVEDLDSLNAFRHLPQGAADGVVRSGDRLRVGHTQLRVWQADAPIAPERRLPHREAANRWPAALAWIVAMFVLTGAGAWMDGTGPEKQGAVSLMMLLSGGLMLVWGGLWWLADSRSREAASFLAHLGIAAMILCLIHSGVYLANTVVFAAGAYSGVVGNLSDICLWGALSYGLYRHLRMISRRRPWVIGLISALCVGGLLLFIRHTLNEYDQREHGEMSIPSAMRPGWMLLVDGETPDDFLIRALAAKAASK